ncbi:MAG: GYD domain-containing protein [Nitrospinota bacterium]
MSAHVFMFRLTPEGAKNPAKIAELRKQGLKKIEELGGKAVAAYLLLGPKDALIIVEGLDDKKAMAFAASRAASGLLTTETYAAVPADEAIEMLSKT